MLAWPPTVVFVYNATEYHVVSFRAGRLGETAAEIVRTFRAPSPVGEVVPGRIPSFSVVIAAYQAAATIKEAVESSLSQTVAPLEVVVCDDGSTDDLRGALTPYTTSISIIHQPHRGAAAAWNAAVQAAKGDFVALLGADDVFLRERLEALGELAAVRPDLDILATDLYVEVDGRIVGTLGDRNPFPVDNQRSRILESCFPSGAAAVRRERLLTVGGFDEALPAAVDWDCWLRLILGGSHVGLVVDPLYRYRLHDRSITAQRVSSLRARVRILEKHFENPSLSASERSILDRELQRRGRDATLAEAEAGVRSLIPCSRARLARLALSDGLPWRARFNIGLSAIARRPARWAFERRLAASGKSYLTTPAERWRRSVSSGGPS